MPLPVPKKGEKEDAFVSRCMGDGVMNEDYPESDQRAAICHSQFGKKMAANLSLNEETKQVRELRHLMSNLIRRDKLEGEECLVCPTVLIVEGVHNGMFYPNEELEKFPDSWNGRPVIVNHTFENGKAVTANQPKYLEKQTVGHVFNTRWDSKIKKLVGEAWIGIKKCVALAPDILKKLETNMPIEVSTGLFTECDGEAGEWNGEKHNGTVMNYRPDHLALLPNDVGACSWEDGAGMPRINSKEGGEEENEMTIQEMAMRLSSNEVSHQEIWTALNKVLSEKVGKTAYVLDVYDDWFTYDVNSADGVKMFKQGYKKDDKGTVVLTGNPSEVKRKTEYVPVTNEENNGEAEGQGDTTTQGGSTMDRSKLVEALIANSDWSKEDSDVLTKMSDAQFKRVTAPHIDDEGKPVMNADAEAAAKVKADADEAKVKAEADAKVKAKDDGVAPVANKEQKKEEKKDEAPKTVEDILNNIENGELKETLTRAIARDKGIKDGMVADLVANKACPFTKEQLEVKPINELEGLLALAGSEKKAMDFTAQSPAPVTNVEEDVPAMPKLFANKEEKKG